jgi:hypothetical protein
MKSLFTSCCMHWKVIVALAAVGLAVAIAAPGALAAAIPLLIVAICPLSMLFMIGNMVRSENARVAGDQARHRHTTSMDRAAELRAELAVIDARMAALADERRVSEPADRVTWPEAERPGYA